MSNLAQTFIVAPDELRSLIVEPSVKIVDSRSTEEYRRGHLAGAVSLPLRSVPEGDMYQLIKQISRVGIDEDTTVVVYDDNYGAVAARIAWTFLYIGHGKVCLSSAMYKNLVSQSFQSSVDLPVYKEVDHQIRIDHRILADVAEVEKISEGVVSRSTLLIDNSERLNFLEGHIPRAQNIPWRILSDTRHILRNLDQFGRVLKGREIYPDANIVTYCGSAGTVSSLGFFAFRLLGFKDVRLYAKAFNQWKSLGLPVEGVQDAHYWDLSAEISPDKDALPRGKS